MLYVLRSMTTPGMERFCDDERQETVFFLEQRRLREDMIYNCKITKRYRYGRLQERSLLIRV